MNTNGHDDGREPPPAIDPEPSEKVLRALDATVADLQTLRRSPVAVAVPADVAKRLDALLTDLSLSVAPSAPGGTVVDLAAHRRRRAGRTRVLGAVAAGIVGLTGVGAATVLATAQSSTSGTPTAARLELGGAGQLGTTALAALGAVDLGTRLSDTTTLRGCLRANGVPASTQLLGSAQVNLRGRPGTLLLLPTQTAGSFVALVVAPGCSATNPALITSARIGR